MATIAVTNVRRACGITPEIYFVKHIDNSRLVKVQDPQQKRDMMLFAGALALLLFLFLGFCYQHYSAIEYGYRNEALRQERDRLLETQRRLQLDEAQLREPWRIDEMAHRLGLQAPEAAQIVSLDNSTPTAPGGGPVMSARAATISVISATQ